MPVGEVKFRLLSTEFQQQNAPDKPGASKNGQNHPSFVARFLAPEKSS